MTPEETLASLRKPIRVLAYTEPQFELWRNQYKLHPADVQRVYRLEHLQGLHKQTIVMLPLWYRAGWCDRRAWEVREMLRAYEFATLEFEEWEVLGMTQEEFYERRHRAIHS